ncbi:uncharacterized protein LOC123472422 [Daphnia magna]|uniref:uncharacterized protein LOC123472422 n=1 Tax=Daphnia magna TaxID=35525 RepID=UPI001E1BA3E2|nr:uncharacterized protein LOC123472422 [Daphnia magna]
MVTHALLRDLIPQKRLISKVLQTFLTRFTQKVEKEVKLPLNQFEEIEALNTALLDMELSVSLCAIQIDKLRLLKTELLICKSLFVSLLSAQLPHKIQWKKRGQDRRPGFGHLTNFVVVFGVVVMAILETHKKQTNISKIITAVQTARRFHAAQYQKYLNTDDEANDEDVVGEGERPRVDVQTISEIESRVNQILKSLEVYSDTQA